MPEREPNDGDADQDRPRLLVLASTYPRWSGDTEPAFVHELCRRLCPEFRVRVICPHAHGARRKEIMDGVEIRRFRYAPLRLQRLANEGGIMANLKHGAWKWLLLPGFMIALFIATWRQVRRWRPDVLHAHWLIPQGLVAALLSLTTRHRIPILVTSHGTDLHGLRHWPFTTLKRIVTRQASAVTVVSSAMIDAMKKQGIDTEKVSIEPMGVDFEHRFTPDSSIARSNHDLLFVGRLTEVKGLHILIDAMHPIVEAHPHSRLIVVGSGPEEHNLRARVRDQGLDRNVIFHGALPQDALPQLYRQAAVFVAPSIRTKAGHEEGLGLAAIEAIGCGCPAIVTDIPATRDVIAQKELRVQQRSPTALAESICGILSMTSEERRALADTQRQFVLGRLDWTSRAASYARLLRRLTSSS